MNSNHFKNITVQLLADDTTSVPDEVRTRCIFLNHAYGLDIGIVIGDADPTMNTEKLGHFWESVKPDDGQFTFTLATELPFYLPTVEGMSEYALTVGGDEIIVSLRMLRAFRGEGHPTTTGTQYLLVHRLALDHLNLKEGSSGIHPIVIKTFVCQKFSARGHSAETVIQQNYCLWRDQLIANTTKVVDSVRAALPGMGHRMLPQEAESSFPLFWVAVHGGGCAQFVGDIGLAAFRPEMDLNGINHERFTSLLNDPAGLAPHVHALSLAKTFAHHGYLGFAIVQVCVACESVLGRAFRDHMVKCGASNKKIKENEKDISFSQLLNLHLFSMRKVSLLNDSARVIGKINWARGHRNDVVHQGTLQSKVTKEEVGEAIEAASLLIDFINDPLAKTLT